MLKHWRLSVSLGVLGSLLGLLAVTIGPDWLGDPRGFSLRNPLIELAIYLMICAIAFMPSLCVMAVEGGCAGTLVSLVLLVGLAAMPLLAFNEKNEITHYSPLNGSDEAGFQLIEAMAVWAFFLLGGMAMLVGFAQGMGHVHAWKSTPSSDLDKVTDQNVLGDARYAAEDEIHAALEGHAGPFVPPEFDD